ncbi:MAG: response regulator [Desulfobacterales bacterium]|jgi:DNA-binding NtrC family response regulator
MDEKVLLVDDEEEFLDTLAERMRNRDMQVTTSMSAVDAVHKTAVEDFDVIVLDLQMPGMDGIQAFKALKQRKPDLQVIFLTGHATVQNGIEAMKLGAMDFLEKPADINELTERIKKARVQKMVLVEKKAEEKIREIWHTKAW